MAKSAPEPLEIDLDAPPPSPAAVAELAWRRLAAAVTAGRCAEAQGWGRLHRQLRALADAEEKTPQAAAPKAPAAGTTPKRPASEPTPLEPTPDETEAWVDAVLAGRGPPPARRDALFAQAGRGALAQAEPPPAPPARTGTPLAPSRPPLHALQRFEGSTLSGAFSAALRA